MKKCLTAVLLLITLVACSSDPGAVRVTSLTCDNRPDATGVDVAKPVFGWEIAGDARGERQRACRILVAASPDLLEPGRADIWDSGRLTTPQSQFVAYGGRRLEPGRVYFWKAGVWGERARRLSWSEAARFTTELEKPEDWSGARWIAFEELPEAMKVVPGVHGDGDELGERGLKRAVVPAFRKAFETRDEAVGRALVFVSGLGHYELRLNGQVVADSFLAPGWTDYRKTCLYNTYDVTAMLKPGANAIGALVGPGFFNVNRERYRKLVIAHGLPMLIVKLDILYASGRRETVVSGPDWRTAPSARHVQQHVRRRGLRRPARNGGLGRGRDSTTRPGRPRPSWPGTGRDCSEAGRRSPRLPFPGFRAAGRDPPQCREIGPGAAVYDLGQNAPVMLALEARGPGRLGGPSG